MSRYFILPLFKSVIAGIIFITTCQQFYAASDDLITRITTEALTYRSVTFATTIAEDTIDDGSRYSRVMQYDLARPSGQRWSLISADGKPATVANSKEFAKEAEFLEPPESYAIVSQLLTGAKISPLSETTSGALFSVVPNASFTFMQEGKNIATSLTYQITVNNAQSFVQQLVMTVSKPISISGAKISQGRFIFEFIRRENGDIIPSKTAQNIKAKILFVGYNFQGVRQFRVVGPLFGKR
jgi:hypothetical protein